MAKDHEEITQILHAWSGGDEAALDELIPLVFDDLHRMACYFFQRESDTHTLQATALVNEVYFSFRGQKKMDWESREDFFHFAAEVMRHFLVSYARRRKARKRGGDVVHVSLDATLNLPIEGEFDVVDLDRALEDLEKEDARQSRIVELYYFIGLTLEEIAVVMDVSTSTVKRELRLARFWLGRRLRRPPSKAPPPD